MQKWLKQTVPGSLKRISDPKSPYLNPFDCHVWGAILEKYYKLQPKPKMTDELKVALQNIWEELSQEHINKAVANFTRCLTAYIAAATNDGHFKHLE